MAANLGPKGLYTFANELEYPDGALQEADNIVIDKEGVAQTRRGFTQYGSQFGLGSDRVKQLLPYKKKILRHYNSTLDFDDGLGNFTAFTGDVTEVETGLRIKGQEANGNFYITTNSGIKKISSLAASAMSLAGGVKALDVEANISYKQAGFFKETSKVAYRIVWGYKDENNNVILGVPSPRAEVVNRSTTQQAITTLNITIPSEVELDKHFYQVYRSANVGLAGYTSVDDIAVDDELQLIIEDFPTSTDIANGYIILDDITPDDFRANGAPLYTNVNSGEGILQANERPPLAHDITLFNGSLFFSNTKTVHRKQVNLLTIDGFTSGTSKLVISDGSTTDVYKFVGTFEEFSVDLSTHVGVIPTSLYGKYFTAASFDDKRMYYVWYTNGVTTVDPQPNPNWIGIAVDISTETNLLGVTARTQAVLATDANFANDFAVSQSTTTLNFSTLNVGKATDATAGTTGFTVTTSQQGDGEDEALKQIRLSGLLTPGQQIDDTARSIVRIVNKNNTSPVIATYLSSSTDVPGQINFESKTLNDTPIFFAVEDAAIANKFNPSLPVVFTAAVTTGTPTVTLTKTAHGLAVGDTVILYDATTTPAISGKKTVLTVPTADTFTVTATVTSSGTVKVIDAYEKTDNEVSPNRLFYSKFQQPEAVPLLNYIDVGTKDSPIVRILPLRDSLFVFKTDGIYQLFGAQAGSFSLKLFDNSAAIIAADSAAILNNMIYVLTTQGISQVSEQSVSIISRNIEDKLTKLNSFTNLQTCFALTSETDRSYFLFTPQEDSDLNATHCLRYNIFTRAWTRWPMEKRCGVRNPGNDKIYLGPTDLNVIEIERKSYTRKDIADRQYELAIPQFAVKDNVIQLSSTGDIVIGDVLIQKQYLTITQFNRLLSKLDMDPGLNDTDYEATCSIVPGDNLVNKMNQLKLKLQADDTGASYPTSVSPDFADLQADFNVMINTLNGGTSAAFYKTFQQSTGTTEVEALVTAVSFVGNRVTLNFVKPLLEGPITHYKAIKSKLTYVPQHFGDPMSLKQVNEATFIFKFTNFTSGVVSYNSDVEQNFEKIAFDMLGTGTFGAFVNGQHTFGGQGNKIPVRTYIPRTKQRCRFLQCRFEHANAFEVYELYGISLNPRVISTRGYR